MPNPIEPRVPKWPFIAGDVLLLGTAYFVYLQSKFPMGAWQLFFVIVCVGGGALLCLMPFLLEYRLTLKLTDANTLTSAIGEIQKVEKLAEEIKSATGQWQGVQEQANKTASLAKEMSEKMGAEVKAFTDFLEHANDNEKATLRLEVEKLKRAEGEWLQVMVRVMDHVHALHQGAVRSGQPGVVEQVGNFQGACRDAVRRVGLVPYMAEVAEKFDATRHQLVDLSAKAEPDATIAETLASGYTFQGRLVRPALVRLNASETAAASDVPAPEPDSGQRQLSLESTAAG